MKSTDLPALVGTPFGENGIKTPISQNTSPGTNAASYNDGFPAITMTELNNGGLPPRGSDFNQILYELAKSVQWAGTGALYKFSADFSTKIGGYPKGSKVIGSDGDVYECLTDDNMNDPVGGAGWVNKGEDKNTRELWRRSLAEAGITLVSGSFQDGATVNSATDAVWDIDGAQCYTWSGTLPHNTEGSPGVGWVGVGNLSFRNSLYEPHGSSHVYFTYANIKNCNRSVQSKLRDRVSILDFVTADDSDDNYSPVLQRALNYIASLPVAERPEIHAPAKHDYLFKDRVIWPLDSLGAVQDIAVVGDFITNARYTGTTKFTFTGIDSVFLDLRNGDESETSGGFRISGISFYGGAGQIGVNAWSTVGSVIENLSFGGFSTGLKIPGPLYYSKIDNCNCFGLQECGMELGLLNGTTIFRCRFNKIDSRGSVNGNGTCIRIRNGGFGGQMFGCWMEDTRKGVDISTTAQFEITGCYVEGVVYPIYSSDISGGTSRVRVNRLIQTIWNDNTRLAVSENGGHLVVDDIGHRSTGAKSLVNISFGLRANGGTISMNIVDYRPIGGTPLEKFGYDILTPETSGVIDESGNLGYYAKGKKARQTTSTRDIVYVPTAQIDNATLVKKTSDTRKIQYANNVKTSSLTFNLPSSATESRTVTALIRASFSTGGRAQRFWRGVLMIQSQAGSADVRALLTDTFTSESLDERALTRTISSIAPVVDISGTNAVLSFTLVSGGSEAPFIMNGVFDITVVNDTPLYALT